MLRLQSTQPEWLGLIASLDEADPRPFLLPGVRVRFAPIGIKEVRAARQAVMDALAIDAEDMVAAVDALSAELIRRGIREWEGVGDRDGEPLPVTPESVAMFVADPIAVDAAAEAYASPWILRDLEGNASAGSPNGTGAAETPADDTALSPAAPTGSADADMTTAPLPALT